MSAEAPLGLPVSGTEIIDRCFEVRAGSGLWRSRMIELQNNQTQDIVEIVIKHISFHRFDLEVITFIDPLILVQSRPGTRDVVP